MSIFIHMIRIPNQVYCRWGEGEQLPKTTVTKHLSVNSLAAFWRTARRGSEYQIKLQVSWNNFPLPPSADHWSSDVQLQTEAESEAGVEAAPQPHPPEVRKRWFLIPRKEVGMSRGSTGVTPQFRLQSDVNISLISTSNYLLVCACLGLHALVFLRPP